VSGNDRVFHRVAHAFVVIFRVGDVSALSDVWSVATPL
jgi:hypothetical protein